MLENPFKIQWLERYKSWIWKTSKSKIGGGSSRGSMDHIVAAQIFKAAGGNPTNVRYVPYDAGGKSTCWSLTGEVDVLSTGLGRKY